MKKIFIILLLFVSIISAKSQEFGILVNGDSYHAITNPQPKDPDSSEFMVLNVYVTQGAHVKVYDFTNQISWAMDFASGSSQNFTRNSGDYSCLKGGFYDFYIQFKFEGDEIFIADAIGDNVAMFSAYDFEGQGTSGTGSLVTLSKYGITIACDKAFGSESSLRCYAGSNLSISAHRPITHIKLFYSTVLGTYYNGGLSEDIYLTRREWTTSLSSQARIEAIMIYFDDSYIGIDPNVIVSDTCTTFNHLTEPEINIQWYAEMTDYEMSGDNIKAISYTGSSRDDYMLVDFRGLQTKYSSSVQKSYVLKFANDFVQFDTKGFEITVPNVKRGQVVRFYVSAKGSTAANFMYNDQLIFENVSRYTDLSEYPYIEIIAFSDGDITIKETTGGFRLSKIAIQHQYKELVNLHLYSSNDRQGSVHASTDIIEVGDNVTISAEPFAGYYFKQWSDGNTDNPRTITLDKDTTIIAEFSPMVMVSSKNNYKNIQNASAIWPIFMDEITYASNQELVVADFRSTNDYENYYANNFYIWEDTYYNGYAGGLNSMGTSLSYLSLIVGSVGWSGCGFNLADPQSLKAYKQLCYDIAKNPDDYYIHFAMKSTDNATHLICAFNDANNAHWSIGDSYDNGTLYPSDGDFVRNGEWAEFNFPLAPFANRMEIAASVEYRPNIFYILSGDATGAQLNLDAIYIYRMSKDNTSTTDNDGIVQGCGYYIPGDTVTLTAVPAEGKHFIQWQDGNTDNPRQFIATQDTVFTAEFTKKYHCGKTLIWSLEDGILTISGYGDMFNYNASSNPAPWNSKTVEITSIVLPDGLTSIGTYAFDGLQNRSFKKLIIPQTVTRIGASAFIDCNRLTSIHLPYALEEIGDYAFAECTRINDITILAPETPDTYEHTFDNVSRLAYLYVPCENKRAYQLDAKWKDFDIQCIGAEQSETTATDSVVVVPSTNDATITWPSDDNAASYTIEITKDGEVFCRLIFNANGQLTGIAFAPSRSSEQPNRAALAVAGGWQFTVTGLNPGTKYSFEVTTKDSQDTTLNTYTGTFETEGEAVVTGLDDIVSTRPNKLLHNGHLLIQRDGKTYNMQGAVVNL